MVDVLNCHGRRNLFRRQNDNLVIRTLLKKWIFVVLVDLSNTIYRQDNCHYHWAGLPIIEYCKACFISAVNCFASKLVPPLLLVSQGRNAVSSDFPQLFGKDEAVIDQSLLIGIPARLRQ